MTGHEIDVPWLSILGRCRSSGAVALMLLPRSDRRRTAQAGRRSVSRWSSLAISIGMAMQFDADGGYQFVEMHEWIPAFGAHYAVGLDGLGLLLVLLTTILTPVVILASWNDADEGRWSVNAFFAWMLGARGSGDRRVRRHRRLLVLRAVRGDADPDLLPDRRLRRRPPVVRLGEVPAVQPLRRPADAGVGGRPVRRELRHRRAARRTCSGPDEPRPSAR